VPTFLELLRELAAFVVADVARRRAQKLGDLVLALELGHVDPDETLHGSVDRRRKKRA